MPPNNESVIVNPNEHLDIPPWINAEYFKDIVARDESDAVAIKTFTPTAAIPPGENFASVMLRIHLDLEMKGAYRNCFRFVYNLNGKVVGHIL